MKQLIEIHVLQNFAPSNLNRDETGAPKDAFFGGTRRGRVSSQCNKRAVRQYFKDKMRDGAFGADELAIRTKLLYGELRKQLVGMGRPEADVTSKIEQAITATGLGLKGEKTEYLLFLATAEIAGLANMINDKWDEIGDLDARISAIKTYLSSTLNGDEKKLKAVLQSLKLDGDKPKIKEEEIAAIEGSMDQIAELLTKHIEAIQPQADGESGKPAKRKKSELPEWEKDIQEILKEGKKGVSPLGRALRQVLDGGKSIDLALFGRMLADMPEKNQHAACQVAHAISTHAIEREFDYYTALDDLKPNETPGADMLGTIDFNSACYYRYAVVDWEKLIGDASKGTNLHGDTELAFRALRVFLEGFVLAEPTGKQNSFAAHNPPEFVAISVCHDAAPRNLANAFETAIRAKASESLTRKSAEALATKGAELETAYPRKCRTFVLNLARADLNGFGTEKASLDEVLEETLKAVKG